ncbi:Uncharacterized protein FKW44_000809, partial [Caligus rogercresseyi]
FIMSGRPLPYPYTLGSQFMQMPWKWLYANNTPASLSKSDLTSKLPRVVFADERVAISDLWVHISYYAFYQLAWSYPCLENSQI